MGITIHFKGNLKNTNLIKPLIEELVDIAETMEWKYQTLDEDWSESSSAILEHNADGAEFKGHFALKGISINLHPDSEPLLLFFDADGVLTTPITAILINEGQLKKKDAGSFVKTQFAPPDIHIAIINLLRYLKKRYIPDLDVYDEAEYWETGNKETLIGKIDFLNKKMDMLEGMLSDIKIENSDELSPDELASRLEEELRKRLKGDSNTPNSDS